MACAGVTSISTESRDLKETEICRRMEAAALATGTAGIIFKKIDSTLRGNVRAEILAAMAAFGRQTAIITPAYPEMGRRVRDGYLHVETPPERHRLSSVLPEMEVLDAMDNRDLDRIVGENLPLSEDVLWAGSAGLASALARKLYGEPQPLTGPLIDGPLIYCIGSDHPVTVGQVRALTDHKVLAIARGRTTPDEIRHALAGAGALFITGGDTASTVLFAIGAKGIAVQHEVLTGVPWGVLSGGSFDGMPVVTKSGGFGAPDTLLRVADFFSK